MKKFPKFLALFVSVLFAGFLFAGCDKDSGPILESISLKDNTLVLQVPQNDDFYSRLQDVIVIAKYSNGEKEITYEDLTFSNTINTAELGDQTLTITYDGKSVNVTITITEHFDTMYVKDNTIPTSVLQYHDFTIDNAVLVFQSSNGEASNIEYKLSEHDDIVVEGDKSSATAGNKTLTFTYLGLTTTFDYKVLALSAIKVNESLVNTNKYKYKDYDDSSLAFYAEYEDGSTEDIAKNDSLLTYGAEVEGEKLTVSATYRGKTYNKDFNLFIIDIDSIELSQGSISGYQFRAPTYDVTTFKVMAKYIDDTTQEFDSEITVNNIDTALGKATITLKGLYSYVYNYNNLDLVEIRLSGLASSVGIGQELYKGNAKVTAYWAAVGDDDPYTEDVTSASTIDYSDLEDNINTVGQYWITATYTLDANNYKTCSNLVEVSDFKSLAYTGTVEGYQYMEPTVNISKVTVTYADEDESTEDFTEFEYGTNNAEGKITITVTKEGNTYSQTLDYTTFYELDGLEFNDDVPTSYLIHHNYNISAVKVYAVYNQGETNEYKTEITNDDRTSCALTNEEGIFVKAMFPMDQSSPKTVKQAVTEYGGSIQFTGEVNGYQYFDPIVSKQITITYENNETEVFNGDEVRISSIDNIEGTFCAGFTDDNLSTWWGSNQYDYTNFYTLNKTEFTGTVIGYQYKVPTNIQKEVTLTFSDGHTKEFSDDQVLLDYYNLTGDIRFGIPSVKIGSGEYDYLRATGEYTTFYEFDKIELTVNKDVLIVGEQINYTVMAYWDNDYSENVTTIADVKFSDEDYSPTTTASPAILNVSVCCQFSANYGAELVSRSGDSVTVTVYGISDIGFGGSASGYQFLDPVITSKSVDLVYTDGGNFYNEYYDDDNVVITNIDNDNGKFTAIVDSNLFGEQSVEYSYTLTKLTSITINEENIPVSVDKGTVFEDLGIVVTAHWGDYSLDVTELADVEFDTSSVGTTTLTITFGNKTLTYNNIEVTGANYDILSYKYPDFVKTYVINSNNQNTYTDYWESGNKGFTLVDDMATVEDNIIYKVGSDNEFVYNPVMSVLYFDAEDDDDAVEITDFAKDVTLFEYNENTKEFVELTEEQKDGYVTISHGKNYQFDESANNKIFKMRVLPYSMTPSERTKVLASNETEFVFQVVSGWNAYTAADLSIIDNTNAKIDTTNVNNTEIDLSNYDSTGKWTTLKQNNGIDLNNSSSALILHSNINITANDIPSIHTYTQDGNKYMIDSLDEAYGFIYTRTMGQDETFTIEGNFFTINASGLPHIIRQNGRVEDNPADVPVVAHTTLLRVLGDRDGWTNDVANAESQHFVMNNVAMFGNSNNSENNENWGGIMFTKINTVNSHINNCLAKSWYIMFLFEGFEKEANNLQTVLTNTNCFDANNCLLYVWATRHLSMDNCVMIGAGGPALIVDYKEGDVDGECPSNVAVKDTIIQSWVTGQESWFNSFGEGAGTLLAMMAGLNQLYDNPYYQKEFRQVHQVDIGGTLTNVEFMNIIALYKSGDMEDISTDDDQNIKGTFVDNTMVKDAQGNDTEVRLYGPVYEPSLATNGLAIGYMDASAIKVIPNPAIAYLMTTNGSFGIPGNDDWADGYAPDIQTVRASQDYLYLYMKPYDISIIFGFYDIPSNN